MDCTSCWVHGIFIFILRAGSGYLESYLWKEGAENLYSKATLEVGRLDKCLNAIKIALSTSEEETNVAQMRADEAHARAAGKISLKSLYFYIRNFIW